MKFRDVIYNLICVFTFKFYHNLLPSAFHYFLLLYQVGTSIILDCLLNQRFVFLLPGLIMGSLTFVSRGLFFGIILRRL